MEPAPYRADLAEGPREARCVWSAADDSVRIRIGLFESGSRGTVLIFPGRTECVEKYGRVAARFAEADLSSLVIDWRGQGLSDRLSRAPNLGHVNAFPDYQFDVQSALDVAREAGLPTPFYLLCHSMGGAIGLRSLMEGLPVRAAAFSAPMWGVLLPDWAKPIARPFGWMAKPLGLGHRVAPTTSDEPYLLTESFEGNLLTTDPGEWNYMVSQVVHEPGLALAGPTVHWVYQAVRECHWLSRRASPDLPCITGLGSNERVVSVSAIHERMRRWPDGQVTEIPDAEHEILMEAPDRRHGFMAPTLDLFQSFPSK